MTTRKCFLFPSYDKKTNTSKLAVILSQPDLQNTKEYIVYNSKGKTEGDHINYLLYRFLRGIEMIHITSNVEYVIYLPFWKYIKYKLSSPGRLKEGIESIFHSMQNMGNSILITWRNGYSNSMKKTKKVLENNRILE